MLRRAREACYLPSSLKDVPKEWLSAAFERSADGFSVKQSFREGIELSRQDIRKERPDGPFHLILCRNLAFTYFDDTMQKEVLSRILGVLVPEGVLVIGRHEDLSSGGQSLVSLNPDLGIFRKP